MSRLLKFVKGYSPEFVENGSNDDVMCIDIAVEFSLSLFFEVGISNIEIDDNGYIHNELGSFYYNGTCCWMWAITNKTTNSRDFNHVGNFYLTDGETANRIPTRKKIWADFKKAITPNLDKALKKFAKDNGII